MNDITHIMGPFVADKAEDLGEILMNIDKCFQNDRVRTMTTANINGANGDFEALSNASWDEINIAILRVATTKDEITGKTIFDSEVFPLEIGMTSVYTVEKQLKTLMFSVLRLNSMDWDGCFETPYKFFEGALYIDGSYVRKDMNDPVILAGCIRELCASGVEISFASTETIHNNSQPPVEDTFYPSHYTIIMRPQTVYATTYDRRSKWEPAEGGYDVDYYVSTGVIEKHTSMPREYYVENEDGTVTDYDLIPNDRHADGEYHYC